MDELIEIMNRLQEVFAAAGVGVQSLDLPQVVVVGTQSSGKSSVLEHLAGRSFLPRGPGVVTRCPLELQMTHADAATPFPDEYVIFQHNPTKVFTDYGLIAKEIEEQTGRLAGANKGICSTAIVLRLFSRSKVQLTLVDLPGLTKVPVGDQPPDIEQQTRQLSLRYVNNPNCIILAVTPANADMATCESLKISREVDPEGARTLAVVTKLDLMDSGTDGRDMLNGRVIPVKLGIVGVVNRSQRDIIEGKSVKQSLKDEATFFHTKYKNIAHSHGSPHLAKTVQTILIDQIRKHLPELKDKISEKLEAHRKELRALGHSELDRPALLLDVITRFATSYCSCIEGNLASIQTKELSGGARINYVFHDSLGSALQSIDPVADLSSVAVMTAVQNASGVRPALFVPELAFELLVKRQIRRLRSPSLQCVQIVYEELVRIVQDCVDDSDLGLYRFPDLQSEIYRVATDLLRNRLPLTNQMVDDFIDVQLAYINTRHPDFLANSSAPCARFQEILTTATSQNALAASDEQKAHAADKASRDCRLMKELVLSYFSIVRKSVQDMVPKTIMHLMVNHVSEQIQSELVGRLYGAGDADHLLREGAAVTARRQEAADAAAALQRTLDILADVKPTLIGLSASAAAPTSIGSKFHLTRLSSHSISKVPSVHR